jgi:hypothetical protein
MLTLTIVALYLCLAGVGVYLIKQSFAKNHARYPPGPRGLPLVGNIQDIPHVKPWLTFAEWGKKYGKSLPLFQNHAFQRSHVQGTFRISMFWVSTSSC